METPTEFGVYMGVQIKSARERIGLTQEELALKLGKSTQSISAYETGRRLIPMNELASLAKILDVSIAYFFKKEDTEQAKLETILSQKLSEMHPRFREYTKVLVEIVLEINNEIVSRAIDLENIDAYEFLRLMNQTSATILIGATAILETRFARIELVLAHLIKELKLQKTDNTNS